MIDMRKKSLEHLAIANDVKSSRRELKERLADGEENITNVIADPPRSAVNATIGKVLGWAPGIGQVRTNRILLGANISTSRRLGALTEHEKGRLLLKLRVEASTQWARWHAPAEAPAE